MSGFVAVGTSPAITLTNDGFWPDVDSETARASLRIDASVSDARLEMAIVGAMLETNRDLHSLKFRHLAAGHERLADVPACQINGQSELVATYLRAIYCAAGAELAERYRSYDSTGQGDRNAEALSPTIDEYRRDARYAIRSLLGIPRNTVELI
jgi:hypothetical protein